MCDAPTIRLATHAMGCRFELVLAGAPEPQLRAAGEEAVDEIETAHAQLTRFERASVVSRINSGEPQRIDGELFALFELADGTRESSGGAFDITLDSDSMLALDPSSRTVSVSRSGAIDLGAIAKGFAIDLAIQSLRDAGVTSAFVHAGGSSGAAIGARPDGSPWRVMIGEDAPPGPVHVDLTDRAFSASGDAEQGPHITDPRTETPASDGVFACCIGNSAAVCDAWATALCVLGARPAGMPESIHSILPQKNTWRIEPADRSLVEECKPCVQSTAAHS